MIKKFYKHRNNVKLFFSKKVRIRTVAYGEEIKERFCNWLKLYTFFKGKERGFMPFAQQSIFRAEAMSPAAFSKRPDYTLKLKNETYSTDSRNYLYINGEKRLFLGDFKAFGFFFCDEIGEDKLVALINYGTEGTKLTVFDITDKGIFPSGIKPLKIDSSLSMSAYMLCAERHIFLIRDSVLHYYYMNIEGGELEPVAIFEDKPFEESECCKSVVPLLICDEFGRIFWASEGRLYSIQIGFPKRVTEIDDYGKGEVTFMEYSDKVLTVKVSDRNLSDYVYRYEFNGKRYVKKI